MSEKEAKKQDEQITSASQKAIDSLKQCSASFTQIDLSPLSAALSAFKLRPLLDTPEQLKDQEQNNINTL